MSRLVSSELMLCPAVIDSRGHCSEGNQPDRDEDSVWEKDCYRCQYGGFSECSLCLAKNTADRHLPVQQQSMYQFLIAVRQQDGQQLQTESGETTSCVQARFGSSLLGLHFDTINNNCRSRLSGPTGILWDSSSRHLLSNVSRAILMHDGCISRTIRMVENGIKPIYVFDGKPPQLKSGVVSRPCNMEPQFDTYQR